ncbi:MAG: (Fe-S)-binding protein [Candidatus Wallbacteria bacterium]|nr:(Fe-S)-binding protein [Candidatus Wallbacteria bacterium]
MKQKLVELPEYGHETATCTFCPKMCRFACPVDRVEGSEASSPWGKMTMLRHLQTGEVSLDQGVLASAYKCTGCMACKQACLHGQELPPVFEAVRALAASRGLAHPKLAEKDEAMRLWGNPVGPKLSEELARRVPPSRFLRPAPVLVFFGCTTVKRFPNVLEETVRVLEAAGLDFAVAGPEKLCSGLPSLSHGYPERFREVALRNIALFANHARIVSDCPGAVSTFARKYPELGLPAHSKPEHLSVLLLELVRAGRLSPRLGRVRRAFYHDACHLGRYLGVYDQPRELLERVLGRKVEELAFHREMGLCSGGGGGLPLTNPELAAGIARLPVEEVRARGGDLLVSACPSARRRFQKADPDLEIVDPVSLLAAAL